MFAIGERMHLPRGTSQGTGEQSLRRRWRRAFVVMLLLSIASAATSIGVFSHMVGRLNHMVRDADKQSAILAELNPALSNVAGASHQLIDNGAYGGFLLFDGRVPPLFDEARTLIDDPIAVGYLEEAEEVWQRSYEFLRPVAADPARAKTLETDLSDEDVIHARLYNEGALINSRITSAGEALRAQMRDELAAAKTLERRLVGGLALVFGVSALVTLHLSRRLRHDVLEPVHELGEIAQEYGDGDFARRPKLAREGELAHLAATFGSMADSLEESHQHLATRAYHDALTGLANRASFLERLEATFSAPAENAVLFLDLDDFKIVNDSLGHAAGDELLREVSRRLLRTVRATDLLARLGGDEFAVLLGAPLNMTRAAEVAQRMLEVLAEPFQIEGTEVVVGASIGVALRTPATPDGETLVRQADVVMYLAKGRGKQRFEIYDPEVHDALGKEVPASPVIVAVV